MKTFGVALIVSLLTSSVTLAQSVDLKKANDQREIDARAAKQAMMAGAPRSPLATQNCSVFIEITNARDSFQSIRYCVTVNGNIPNLEIPVGHFQLDANGEGYGVCDASVPTAYYDYGYTDSGTWGPATFTSQTNLVKVVRATTDGVWTLTQSIIEGSSPLFIKVVMALHNNSSTARTAYLVRYADVDADGTVLNSGQDGTTNSAFAWNSSGDASNLIATYGLRMQNEGVPQFPQWGGLAQNTPDGPNPCAFAFNWTGGVATGIDGSQVMAYVGTVPAHSTKTATLTYRGF